VIKKIPNFAKNPIKGGIPAIENNANENRKDIVLLEV
jgi:hypothetical protein